MGKARVAVLAPSDLGRADGNSVRARSVARILAGKYPTWVLTGQAGGGGKLGGAIPVPFFRLEKDTFTHPGKLALANFRLLVAMMRGRFDVIYAQGLMLVPGLVLGAKLRGTRVILEAHSLAHLETAQYSRRQPLFYLILETFAGKMSSEVVALSARTASFYRRIGARVRYVPVFLDPALFRPATKDHDGKPRVGLVGPFGGAFNGGQVEYLLHNLGSFDPNVSFILLGRLDDRPSAANLTSLGYLPDDRYAEELANLDALLVPARVGTYGPKNKVLEAMASGVPVYSSPVGVLGLDYAVPGRDLVVSDLGSLAAALSGDLFRKDVLARVGASGRRLVELHYSEEAWAPKILEALEEVLD